MSVIDSRRQPVLVAVAAAVVAYGWWMAGLAPFTWPKRLAVGGAALLVLAGAALRRRTHTPLRRWVAGLVAGARRARPRSGGEVHRIRARMAWAALITALAGVQLFAYFSGFSGPRSQNPTLSWIIDHLGARPARTALFAAWVGLGVYLGRR